MKKLIVIVCFLFAFNFISHAQVDTRPFIFSAAPEISMPIGDFKKTNKLGVGGNFIAQFSMAEKLKFLASLGGVLYQGKVDDTDPVYSDDYPAVATLRLRGGLKYFLS